MDQKTLDELLDFHLLVLKDIFHGLSISEIEQKYPDKMVKLNYLSIAKANNLLTFDDSNNLIGAYPVSPLKTSFEVAIDNIGTSYCMCAIDALGIAYTFNEKTTIRSKDKSTGEKIEITVDPISEKIVSDKQYYVTYKDPSKVCNIAQDQCPVINFYSERGSIPNDNDLIIFDFNQAIKHAKSIFSQKAFKKSLLEGFKAIPKENL